MIVTGYTFYIAIYCDNREVRIGTVYLLEKTPWGEALELSRARDFFLEIIAGDIMTVTPLLHGPEGKGEMMGLNFNCVRFVRLTEGGAHPLKASLISVHVIRSTSNMDAQH